MSSDRVWKYDEVGSPGVCGSYANLVGRVYRRTESEIEEVERRRDGGRDPRKSPVDACHTSDGTVRGWGAGRTRNRKEGETGRGSSYYSKCHRPRPGRHK